MSSLVKRHLLPRAVRHLQNFPILLIEGARQVGKSTLARQLAPDATVLNLDIPEIHDAVEADPVGALTQRPQSTVIVDEIQLMPELTRVIKAIVDEDRRPGRFLLTGSASLLRVRGSGDSLAGRVSRLNLFGFSQGEHRGTLDDFAAAATRGDDPSSFRTAVTRNDYVELCARGAYPTAATLDADLRKAWLADYALSITHRDLSDLRRQVQPDRAESILRLLASEQSNELVKARLAQRTDVPATSITGYLDLLRDVQLFHPIKPWTPNLAKREIGRPKTLIIDSALAMHLAGITSGQLSNLLHQEAFGRLLEGFVAAELLRQRTWSATPFDLYHYRDAAGAEVDLVLETEDGGVIGIEVKAASSYSGKQFSALRRLSEQLGDRFVGGYVLGTAQHGYRYAPKLWGLPISALWEPGSS